MDRSYTFSFVSKIMNYRNSFQADVRYKHIFLQLVLAHCHIYVYTYYFYLYCKHRTQSCACACYVLLYECRASKLF